MKNGKIVYTVAPEKKESYPGERKALALPRVLRCMFHDVTPVMGIGPVCMTCTKRHEESIRKSNASANPAMSPGRRRAPK